MKKSVLISIRPKWVERILSGEKTIEVRKTAPKIETPFKCYIYCTQSGKYSGGKAVKNIWINRGTKSSFIGNGKIIGEFICDKIYKIKNLGSKFVVAAATESETNKVARESCLSFDDMKEYAGEREYIYGWHISNLTLYNNPKELSEFITHCKMRNYPFCSICDYSVRRISNSKQKGNLLDSEIVGCYMGLKRPPQSWCYGRTWRE